MSDQEPLIAFLHVCLAEDEWVAQAAALGPWKVTEIYDDVFCVADSAGNSIAEKSGNGFLEPGNARHIARQDPARTLTGIRSKRRIIELCESAIEAGQIKPLSSWNDDAAGAEVGEVVLRLMAQPYADRPGYDSAWSVET